MKIAFVVRDFPALSETFVLNQITGLLDRGHEVEIFARQGQNNSLAHSDVQQYNLRKRTHYCPEISENKVNRVVNGIQHLAGTLFRDPLAKLRSLNIFEHGRRAASLQLLHEVLWFADLDQSFDAVHCHFGPFGYIAVLLRQLGVFEAPILTTFHGYDVHVLPDQGWQEPYRKLFHDGDLFTANTNFTKSAVADLGADPGTIEILPMGLNLEQYKNPGRRTSSSGTKILTVARLVEKKGIEYSLKAIKRVARDHDVQYDIVGEGPRSSKLKSLIEEFELGNCVTLHGWKTREEVLEFYRNADLFVLTSVTARNGDMEGQGLVLQEAQLMELPVVTTNHNGLPEGVIPKKSAFLVPERDVEETSERIDFLLHHPELRKTMGEAGRKYVQDHYDIDKLTEELIELYRAMK